MADIVASRSEDPKVIIRVITFELVQPICSRYINVTDRQMNGRLTIAIPRFVLRASHGKKIRQSAVVTLLTHFYSKQDNRKTPDVRRCRILIT